MWSPSRSGHDALVHSDRRGQARGRRSQTAAEPSPRAASGRRANAPNARAHDHAALALQGLFHRGRSPGSSSRSMRTRAERDLKGPIMARAVNVVFSPGGKVYRFDPNGLELAWNERVICRTSRGLEMRGRVVGGQPRGRGLAARPPAAPDRAPCLAGRRGACEGRRALGLKAMLRVSRGSCASARQRPRATARRGRRVRPLAHHDELSRRGTHRARGAAPDRARARLSRRVEVRQVEPARGRPRRAAARHVRRRCAAARASPRTSSRSRCAWPRIRSSR